MRMSSVVFSRSQELLLRAVQEGSVAATEQVRTSLGRLQFDSVVYGHLVGTGLSVHIGMHFVVEHAYRRLSGRLSASIPAALCNSPFNIQNPCQNQNGKQDDDAQWPLLIPMQLLIQDPDPHLLHNRATPACGTVLHLATALACFDAPPGLKATQDLCDSIVCLGKRLRGKLPTIRLGRPPSTSAQHGNAAQPLPIDSGAQQLLLACGQQRQAVVSLLLGCGCDPCMEDDRGVTPLDIATARKGHPKGCGSLLWRRKDRVCGEVLALLQRRAYVAAPMRIKVNPFTSRDWCHVRVVLAPRRRLCPGTSGGSGVPPHECELWVLACEDRARILSVVPLKDARIDRSLSRQYTLVLKVPAPSLPPYDPTCLLPHALRPTEAFLQQPSATSTTAGKQRFLQLALRPCDTQDRDACHWYKALYDLITAGSGSDGLINPALVDAEYKRMVQESGVEGAIGPGSRCGSRGHVCPEGLPCGRTPLAHLFFRSHVVGRPSLELPSRAALVAHKRAALVGRGTACCTRNNTETTSSVPDSQCQEQSELVAHTGSGCSQCGISTQTISMFQAARSKQQQQTFTTCWEEGVGTPICVVCMDEPPTLGFRHGCTVHACICYTCAELCMQHAAQDVLSQQQHGRRHGQGMGGRTRLPVAVGGVVPAGSLLCPVCRQEVDEVVMV